MSDDTTELEQQADELAMKAKQVSADGVSTVRRDLAEIDNHIDRKLSREVSRGRGIGVKFFGLKMPGGAE